MQQITLRLPEEVVEDVEEEAEEAGVTRSEHLREVVESRNEHVEEVERLREEVDELRTNLERVRNEKRQILEQREENQELAKFAEQERTLQQDRMSASAVTRAKWWLFGRDQGES